MSRTAEEARITCAIVDAAAKVRDLNFTYMAEGKGATVTARFSPGGSTIGDPNRAGEGADKMLQRIYDRAICHYQEPSRPLHDLWATVQHLLGLDADRQRFVETLAGVFVAKIRHAR